MPPVTRHLIVINVLIWVIEIVFHNFGKQGIIRHLGLHYIGASGFNPIQLLTYMFVHSQDTFLHIFFNMFTLFFFGPMLERVWGSKRFFIYYMICGIGAALVQEGVWALTWKHDMISMLAQANGLTYQSMQSLLEQRLALHLPDAVDAVNSFQNMLVTVGASGAIFGLLLGFAFVFPNLPLYLFFIPIPIKAKYMVIGYGILELFFGISGSADTVAHFAHLGGMLFGIIIILYWKKKGILYGKNYWNNH